MNPTASDVSRATLARECLDGLSVGDSFGEQFFDLPELAEAAIEARTVPAPEWRFTDDTLMAISVYRELEKHGRMDPQSLAADFVQLHDRSRGYGPSMNALLGRIAQEPENWSNLAAMQFGGAGSHGNGSAMRVAPIGAYFADEFEAVVAQATASSLSTHTHPEAVAGAIAVAVAAALAVSYRSSEPPDRTQFLAEVASHVPNSVVSERLRLAAKMDSRSSVRHAVAVLGNGTELSAQDTVPFALWSAAGNLRDYEEALWTAVSGLGDRDTICAITGAVVASYCGQDGIPREWLGSRESLCKFTG